MTANNAGGDAPKEVSELGEQILWLMDDAGLRYIDAETAAYNLDLSLDEAIAAFEELEHYGEVDTYPVMYERRRS